MGFASCVVHENHAKLTMKNKSIVIEDLVELADFKEEDSVISLLL